jgi:hypothetical protein
MRGKSVFCLDKVASKTGKVPRERFITAKGFFWGKRKRKRRGEEAGETEEKLRVNINVTGHLSINPLYE